MDIEDTAHIMSCLRKTGRGEVRAWPFLNTWGQQAGYDAVARFSFAGT